MLLWRRILLSAVVLVSWAVVVGIGASGAAAAPTCAPEGTNIQGIGSSLQKVAQEIWTGREVPSGTPLTGLPHTANALADSYREKCASKTTPPSVSYTTTSAEMALHAFGYTGSKSIEGEIQFISTDEGPDASQIVGAEEASGVKPVVLPVTQTAIAVVVHPPTGCTLQGGITWRDLDKVFGGSGIKKWSEFSTKKEAVAGDCEHEISRVVLKEASTVTLQFKAYLATLEEAEGLPCETEGHRHWAELEEIGPEGKPNTTWPECPGGTPVLRVAGGGALAQKVAETEGTIGYAVLSDAKAHGAGTAKLQNGEVAGEPTFAEPGNSSTDDARCANARYTVPEAGREGLGTGLSVDWSTVFDDQPMIGGTEYPLCMLTYVAGWNKYTEADYGTGHKADGEIVKDYVASYVVPTGEGQKAIEGHWYSTLPAVGGAGSATDVQNAAEFIAGKLG